MPSAEFSLSLPEYLQQNEPTEEFKDLIASLPTRKGWVANYLHQYQGFWHTTRQLQGVVACRKHFQAQDGDVFLVTTPKSGSTWLKAIMFALMNRAKFPDPKQHPLLTNNPHALVPFLELEYIGKNFPDFITDLTSPRLFSSHLPFVSLPISMENSHCKIVYLCRNPKDAFVSLWHFTNRLRPEGKGVNSLEETFDRYCKGESLYGPFWDHVLDYWNKSLERPQDVLFLKYEEMKNEPKVQLRRLSEFLGCPFCPEEEANGVVDEILELCSFDSLRNLEVNKSGILPSGEEHRAFFRRGEVGDSINYLTVEMVEQMDRITEQKLHGYGLKL